MVAIVDHRSDNHARDGLFHRPLASKELPERVIAHGQKTACQDHLHIPARVFKGVRLRAEAFYDGVQKDQADPRDDHAVDDRQDKADRQRMVGFLVVPRTEAPCDQG